MDAAQRAADRCPGAGPPLRLRTCGGPMAGDTAVRRQRTIRVVFPGRNDPVRGHAGPGRGSGWRCRGQRPGERGAELGERPHRGPVDRYPRRLARRRHRLCHGSSRPGMDQAARARQAGAGRLSRQRASDRSLRARRVSSRRGAPQAIPGSRWISRRAADGLVPGRGAGAMRLQFPERARSFDAWAGDYARYRPGYPDVLFNEIWTRLALPEHPRVVDLGAGTGRASLAMAALGWRVTAVEPGKPMLDVLRAHGANQGLLLATVHAHADAPGLVPDMPVRAPVALAYSC